ncbi:MAG: hypothetical protein IKY33_01700, partial [Clostridia bacterium]|nr:hypothetical protein [Clostridia bacterium]
GQTPFLRKGSAANLGRRPTTGRSSKSDYLLSLLEKQFFSIKAERFRRQSRATTYYWSVVEKRLPFITARKTFFSIKAEKRMKMSFFLHCLFQRTANGCDTKVSHPFNITLE